MTPENVLSVLHDLDADSADTAKAMIKYLKGHSAILKEFLKFFLDEELKICRRSGSWRITFHNLQTNEIICFYDLPRNSEFSVQEFYFKRIGLDEERIQVENAEQAEQGCLNFLKENGWFEYKRNFF